MEIKKVHISTIMAGDTIFHDGVDRTVSKKDIKRSDFMGISIFGDCYKSGTELVSKVIIKRALPEVKKIYPIVL